MSSLAQEKKHDRGCWCESCFFWKLESPEIVTNIIDDYRDYAEDVFKKTGQDGLTNKYVVENKTQKT